ncbi:MAG: bifunctional diaminohydroxyphosphoribosylaminopyrimidine deaminase/5-amino-6-(5-phosphoribosylamino)uracil reductase RibD [Thermoleophilia bacterium]|nr:bifunctional diaminohydroxyphosphoribosylaminopyrimidine deaminase/5-amino-6-(5-phosphoribosylamino)uracil reductase RibD [Thermoleophilia bacterium]
MTLSGRPTAAEYHLLIRACELAERGRGRVSPNPCVGAVIARDGVIVGEGWHAGPGQAHAEPAAIAAAGGAASSATLVCTLEPCSHTGRTGPCTEAIIAAGVARVVIGALDPLERTRGEGARILAEAGIEVVVADGEDAARARAVASPFLTWAVLGRPEVTLKMAASLDGRVATRTGSTRWISSPEARAHVHRLRADMDAVGVGIGTAVADDAMLTARDVAIPEGRVATRVVFDPRARLPLTSALATTALEAPVTVLAGSEADGAHIEALRAAGIDVEVGPTPHGAGFLADGLDALGRRGIQSILIEGGPTIAGALLEAGLVDVLAWVVAPIVIGGDSAPVAVRGVGADQITDAVRIRSPRVERLGDDVLITGRLRPVPGGD